MGQALRKIIEIDDEKCDGCGKCVPSCHEGALVIRDGKARVVADVLCDGLGACLGECPRGALKITEREAVPFDEAAVAQHLAGRVAAGGHPHDPAAAHGCPGAQLRILPGLAPAPAFRPPGSGTSALGHWPVQIRLVPPTAPFLDGADLLVAADCVPVACPTFHSEMLPGRAVMIGCPKFDDLDGYVQRFAALFAASDVKSVTIAVMEVPCCRSLPVAVERGMALAGRSVPVTTVVVGVNGAAL